MLEIIGLLVVIILGLIGISKLFEAFADMFPRLSEFFDSLFSFGLLIVISLFLLFFGLNFVFSIFGFSF
jgi:hypothetical protein